MEEGAVDFVAVEDEGVVFGEVEEGEEGGFGDDGAGGVVGVAVVGWGLLVGCWARGRGPYVADFGGGGLFT